ncbi:YARHG domain-containing protein [Parolsenella catena]|uniref:YARHG domain-containing protein n=1 Tax=Parolsenella catena TaxID=2003188 RepID=UPI002FDCAFE0
MFCTKCGAQLPDGSKFCTKCGTPTDVVASETTVMPAAGETHVMSGQPTQAVPQTGQPMPQATQVAPRPVSPQAPYGAAPQQPVYSSVPQQPAYGQGGQGNGGSRRGVVVGVVVAIIAVAIAAVAFIMVDPMGLFGGKTGRDAATTAASSPAASSTSAADTSAASTSAASTSAASSSAASISAQTHTPAPRGASSDYVIPDSDCTSYTADDIKAMNLSVDELWYARNEIYARHGRKFQNETLQAYFNSKPWYTPEYSPDEYDDSVQLSSVERANAAAIKSVEQSMGSNHL